MRLEHLLSREDVLVKRLLKESSFILLAVDFKIYDCNPKGIVLSEIESRSSAG